MVKIKESAYKFMRIRLLSKGIKGLKVGAHTNKELKLSLLKLFKRNTKTRRKDALRIWETRIRDENRIKCKIIKILKR